MAYFNHFQSVNFHSFKKALRLITVLFLLCVLNINVMAQNDTIQPLSIEDFNAMSLTELVNIKVSSPTLTEVKNKLPSVPVILITQTDIELSGARSLDELLEIYVPGFTMMYKGWTGNSLGVRGIISDRNNKVLLLVNGKVMNGRALVGVVSERLLTMLNDIERIEVIQSPQSSLYGAGAISSVINIYTKDGKTKGAANEFQVNQGVIDNFTNVQFRHSKRLNDDFSFSAYYGGDYATGASQENSPTKFSFDQADGNGDTIIADQPLTYSLNNLNASFHNQPRHKAHFQMDYKNWSTWVRYTNGGMNFSTSQPDIIKRDDVTTDTSSYQYKHITTFTSYKNNWRNWGIDARLSYDQFSNRIQNRSEKIRKAKKNRENEFYSRVILKYTSDKLSIGIGPALSYEQFGLPAFGETGNNWLLNPRMSGYSYDITLSDSVNAYNQSWSTLMLSGIGEAQYSIRDNINVLTGVRVDKHIYTGIMVSPRASIVWKSKDDHLMRFQYSRSNRRQDDADLRYEFLASGEENGAVEAINFYELSGDIHLHEKVVIRPSVYYSDYDVVAWSSQISKPIGNLKYYGAELSAIYKGAKGYGQFSHSFVRISEFSEVEEIKNNVSASAYGYGNSFGSFPDHLTKLFYQHKINKKMSLSTSLQITWKLKGAEDMANYNRDSLASHVAWDLSDNATTSHKPSAYLNAGYVYKITDKLKASFFAYNLLGLIDEDLNKRVEFQKTSHYRIQPVAFKLRVDIDF